MLNITYLRELCENATPFVISAAAREALPELLDRVEALEKFKALASAYFKALEKGPDIPQDCSVEEFQERCDVFGQVTDDLFAAIIMALRENEEGG